MNEKRRKTPNEIRIEELGQQLHAAEAKLEVIRRMAEGEGVLDMDYRALVNDYGVGWDKDPTVRLAGFRFCQLRDLVQNANLTFRKRPEDDLGP